MEIDTGLCSKVGMSPAFIYSVIKEECSKRGVLIKGHPFVCLSVSEIQNALPFLCSKTIYKGIKILEDAGLVESESFLGNTKWRRIIDGNQNKKN